MRFTTLRRFGFVPLLLGLSLILGGDCKSFDDMDTREDCGDELSDGTFTLVKILLIDFFKIPGEAVAPLGIILVLFGLFIIFLKPIKEKLSPENEEWDKLDEET